MEAFPFAYRPDPDTPLNRELAVAVAGGELKRVEDLLRQGASADATVGLDPTHGLRDSTHWMPLPMLILNSGLHDQERLRQVFRLLVREVRNVDAYDSRSGKSLLMMAAEIDDLETVRMLIDRGAKVDGPPRRPEMGWTPLTVAIEYAGARGVQMTPVIRTLLDAGADVNAGATGGDSARATMAPLLLAVQHGRIEVVEELLRRGADPSIRDSLGRDLLEHAAWYGQGELLSRLRHWIPLDLHQAARFGTVEQVRRHLAEGGQVNLPNHRGESPLLLAAYRDDVEVAELLLAAGADVQARGRDGMTALGQAAECGNEALVRLLLSKGADATLAARRGYTGGSGTPLRLAITQSRPEVVDVLLSHRPDPAEVTKAFVFAVMEGDGSPSPVALGTSRQRRTSEERRDARRRVLERLLDAGADVRAHGSICLYFAVLKEDRRLVERLLEAGADANARGPWIGMTRQGAPALMAPILGILAKDRPTRRKAEGGSQAPFESMGHARALMELLLDHGANVDHPDEKGRTPLYVAVQGDLIPLVELLLGRFAKVDLPDREGKSPLMVAAEHGSEGLLQRLLTQGARVDVADGKGWTSLMYAIDGRNEAYRRAVVERGELLKGVVSSPPPVRQEDLPNRDGRPEIVRLLLRHGADPTARSHDGETAESLARKDGFETVLEILSSRR